MHVECNDVVIMLMLGLRSKVGLLILQVFDLSGGQLAVVSDWVWNTVWILIPVIHQWLDDSSLGVIGYQGQDCNSNLLFHFIYIVNFQYYNKYFIDSVNFRKNE